MLSFPNIDPVAISIGGFQIYWYGIAYALGLTIALQNAQKICRTHNNTPVTEKHIDGLFTYAILGIIIGGRLGYVLFYNFDFYLANPDKIIAIWEGGMSFHGGFLGVLIMLYFYAKEHNLQWLYITDRVAPGACIGLFLGRLSNFINGELWGKTTEVPWGMVFPNGGPLPRHPSQLYEALAEGLILYFVLFYLAKRTNREGVISSLFLIGYGSVRFLIEFVREKDVELTNGVFEYISMGQILSLPMIIIGATLLYYINKKKKMLDASIKKSYSKFSK